MLSMSTKFIAHFLRIYAQLFYHAAVRIICVFLYTFSWKYMQKDSGLFEARSLLGMLNAIGLVVGSR